MIKSETLKSNTINNFTQHINMPKIKKAVTIIMLGILLIYTFLYTRDTAMVNINADMYVADFRTDINKLTEVAGILESSKTANPYINIGKFGSTGNLLTKEIRPELKSALIHNIADTDNNKIISNEELLNLQIMKLNNTAYRNELNRMQFSPLMCDNNLEHYVVITNGPHSGTLLYNGPLKFIDTSGKIHFGIDLSYAK